SMVSWYMVFSFNVASNNARSYAWHDAIGVPGLPDSQENNKNDACALGSQRIRRRERKALQAAPASRRGQGLVHCTKRVHSCTMRRTWLHVLMCQLTLESAEDSA